MDNAELRWRFRDFAGPDRYRKFVRSINHMHRRKQRLRFWEEQLWDTFIANGSLTNQTVEPAKLLCVCDIHDCALQELRDATKLTEIRDTPEADEAIENAFPFANNGDRTCPECRTARVRWISENEELCRILRCRTTYEDYCTRRFGKDFFQSFFHSIKERAEFIAALMEPGDELWEWDGGGWHHFNGRAGVAVIRSGRIVQQWCEVRS